MAYMKNFKVVAQNPLTGALSVNFTASMLLTIPHPTAANGEPLTGDALLAALTQEVARERATLELPSNSVAFDATLDHQLGIATDPLSVA